MAIYLKWGDAAMTQVLARGQLGSLKAARVSSLANADKNQGYLLERDCPITMQVQITMLGVKMHEM